MKYSKDYYQVLRVGPRATQDEIRRSYLTLVKMLHPDKFDPINEQPEYHQAVLMLQELNEAYAILGDEIERKKYDRSRDVEARQSDHSRDDQSRSKPPTPSAQPKQASSSSSAEAPAGKTAREDSDADLLRIPVIESVQAQEFPIWLINGHSIVEVNNLQEFVKLAVERTINKDSVYYGQNRKRHFVNNFAPYRQVCVYQFEDSLQTFTYCFGGIAILTLLWMFSTPFHALNNDVFLITGFFSAIFTILITIYWGYRYYKIYNYPPIDLPGIKYSFYNLIFTLVFIGSSMHIISSKFSNSSITQEEAIIVNKSTKRSRKNRSRINYYLDYELVASKEIKFDLPTDESSYRNAQIGRIDKINIKKGLFGVYFLNQ